MPKYKVIVLKHAQNNIDELSDYISNILKNRVAAAKIVNGIYDAIDSLEEFPMRNAIIDCNIGKKFFLRAELLGNFYIIYAVKENTVAIYKVIYAKSNFINKLKENDFDINNLILSEPK